MTYFRNFIQLNKADPKPEKTDKPKKKYSFKKKPTGELPLMLEIWDERGPYSQISGEHLGEFSVAFMAHILPKAKNKYPKFKLNKQNIVIMSFDEHYAFDNNRSSIAKIKEWAWVFELETSLKEKYKQIP